MGILNSNPRWDKTLKFLHSKKNKRTDPNKEGFESVPSADEINKDEEAASSMVLPPQVIMEILTFLPLKPLARAQLVCREWRELIQDRHFMQKHMNRSPHHRHYYNVERQYPNRRAKAKRNASAYLHGCDGLLLVKNNTTLRHFLWNPATKLLLQFPNPHNLSYGMALSFAQATKDYKIVSFFNDSHKLGCQVLTLGRPSMKWRRLEFPQEENPNTTNAEVSVVPAGGIPHCVVLRKAGDETFAEIVSVDVETEFVIINHLPQGVFRDVGAAKVIDRDGKRGLAVVDLNKHEMQVMVLQDFKKKRWCRSKEVIPLPFLQDEGFKGKKVVPLLIKEGGVWFCLEREKVFVYTIKTGEMRDQVKNEGINITASSELYIYKPSMITFQGMRADDEITPRRPSFVSAIN